jgi:phosphotransferase system IIB component
MEQYIIIFIVLIFVAYMILRSKDKDFKLEANKLITCLGGKDNIVNYEFAEERFIVNLKNIDLVSKDAILKLGAVGVVMIDNQVKIVLGKYSSKIKKQIKDLK